MSNCDICKHAQAIYVDYLGATLLDLEHIECHCDGEVKVKPRSLCQTCEELTIVREDYTHKYQHKSDSKH